MASATGNETLFCEQCGAPLQSRAGEEDCLHCLLQGGIGREATEQEFSPNESNTRFYQHYEILSLPDGSRWELGRGAMGVTYKARDINLDTPVALKIINTRFSARPAARQRFLREAQAAARLRHPNVASVYHFGTVNALPAAAGATAEENAEAGDCFYAMEFIEGETLEERLRRCGPLAPALALEIGVQVARALTAAEKRGLVHRDLKPANIMLAAEEEPGANAVRRGAGEAWVKVIDFGLAKLADREEGPAAGFLGTLAFASPEQIEARGVDSRSDLYSLGATLWYALTGKVPFGERKRESKTNAPLPQFSGRKVPRGLIALLQSALACEPGDRPPSAADFSRALQDCLDEVTAEARKVAYLPRSRAGKGVLAAAGLAAAAGLVGLIMLWSPGKSQRGDKSIAVLPFQNLSNNPSDAFFAEGIEDDLLARLVKIHDLKVISRLSARHYPAGAGRDLRAIGKTLGVRHVLEGSLRRMGNRVRLEAELIDTTSGRQRWTERYDRTLKDALSLQGELAGAIAAALDATLSPQEQVDVRIKPTGNPDAYVLYLRGRQFENSPTFAISDFEAAQALYRQAIALDPGFALAHARLASTLSFLYRFRGPSEELKRRAYEEVHEALRLQPNLGEAHLVNALCAYRIERDFDRALPELEKARHLLPNDTEAESFIAYIQRRRGQWREARAGLERVRERDPNNVNYEEELFTTGYLLRDWPYATRHITRAAILGGPRMPVLKVERALVDLWQGGDLAPLRNVFADLPSYGDPEGTLVWLRWDSAMLARDFSAAQAAIDNFPFETLPSVYGAPVSKSYLEACMALAQGDKSRAQVFFETARPAMEAETLAHPEDALRHAQLGLLYAYMGRKADALREGETAVRLQPVAQDAFDGPERLCNLALIHARLGDHDKAISMIELLLPKPGGVFFYEASMSLGELRLRWQWDPLRSDARFQKILAGPEPATVY